jgi:hypothetical protein
MSFQADKDNMRTPYLVLLQQHSEQVNIVENRGLTIVPGKSANIIPPDMSSLIIGMHDITIIPETVELSLVNFLRGRSVKHSDKWHSTYSNIEVQ